MGIVHIEDGVLLLRDFVQGGERRQRAAHAVDAVDGHDGNAIRSGLAQYALQVGGVAVREIDDADAVGLGDLGAFLNRVVGMLVDHEQVLAADQAGHGAHVRQGHGRIDQGCFRSQPAGDLVLGVGIGANTREGARGAVMSAPFLEPFGNDGLHARMLIESQEAIGAEIDHLLSAHAHHAAGTAFVDHQVLEVVVGKQSAEVLDEANEPVLTQGLGKLLHRRM